MRSTHALWRPVAYSGLHARVPRKAVLLHTNGGGTDRGSLYGWWTAGARGDHGPDNLHVGAHFQVMTVSGAEQYVDTSQVVYHAYSASEWAVGIETQDDGHPATPWTPEQLHTIIAICHELQVPGQLLKDGPSDGVGWHEQYADWNKSQHACPGSVREQQIRDVIIPALRTPAPKPSAGPPAWYHRPLRLDKPMMHGADVVHVQHKVGVAADGWYGPATRTAVIRWQNAHRLAPDGVVGPATARAFG